MIRRFIPEGEIYPRGYGFAWWEPLRAGAIGYPIPLNLAARGVRIVFHWLRFGYHGQRLMNAERYERLVEENRKTREDHAELWRERIRLERENDLLKAMLRIQARGDEEEAESA